MTSVPRWCNVNGRSEDRRRKHDVATRLGFRRITTSETQHCDNVVTTLFDVATKIQPKLHVVTTSCASWDVCDCLMDLAIYSYRTNSNEISD